MKTIIGAGLLALLITLVLTPFVKKLAVRMGAMDQPAARKIQKIPMPRMGGLGIYLAFVVAVLCFLPLTKEIVGLLLGATVVVIMGIVDDIRDLPAKLKFGIQIIAALIAFGFGIRIEWLTNPMGGMMYVGHISVLLTVFWIVGITNTVNFIDGLDGLASGVSAIISFTILIIAIVEKNLAVSVIMAALLGGTLGFLPYNFNPAKIFMGDTGSLFLGFVLAAASVMGSLKNATTLVSFSVLAIGLPIFDTAFAMLRRFLHHQPIMQADRGHMHHRLLDMGFSHRQAVLVLYLISACFGILAIGLNYTDTVNAVKFLVIMGGVMVALVVLLSFGQTRREKKLPPAEEESSHE